MKTTRKKNLSTPSEPTVVVPLAGHATRTTNEIPAVYAVDATRYASADNAAAIYETSVHTREELNTVRGQIMDLDLVAWINRAQNLLIDVENVLDELKSTDGVGQVDANLVRDIQSDLGERYRAVLASVGTMRDKEIDQMVAGYKDGIGGGVRALIKRGIVRRTDRPAAAPRSTETASQLLAGDVQAAAIAFHALADRIRAKQTGGDDALAAFLEIDREILGGGSDNGR